MWNLHRFCVHSIKQEDKAVNLVISAGPTQAPSVDMYAQGSVPGLFNRTEINLLSPSLNHSLSTALCIHF